MEKREQSPFIFWVVTLHRLVATFLEKYFRFWMWQYTPLKRWRLTTDPHAIFREVKALDFSWLVLRFPKPFSLYQTHWNLRVTINSEGTAKRYSRGALFFQNFPEGMRRKSNMRAHVLEVSFPLSSIHEGFTCPLNCLLILKIPFQFLCFSLYNFLHIPRSYPP